MERNFAVVVCLAALIGFGCSISNSSDTLSNSISSPFEWSSDSSDSSSDAASAYRQDVSDYTVAFARNGGDLDAFRSGVRSLAESRGVTNWEADVLTCASIGLGLRHAELGELEAMAFGRELLGEDAPGLVALRGGYESIP